MRVEGQWHEKKNSASAIVELAGILGSHPSDPGSSPGGRILSLCVLGKHHRQQGSTLLDLIKVSAKGRERFSWSFPNWHLPKVLIF